MKLCKTAPPSDRRHGFTLVEVVVSVLVLAVGMAGAWSLVTFMFRMNDFSDRMTVATTLAGDKAENLLQTGYDAMATGSDATNSYNRTWTVAAGPVADTKTIQVTVQWNDVDGQSHQSVIDTLVTTP